MGRVALPVCLLAALLSPAAPASAAEIIVQREPGLSATARADVRADAGATLVRPLRLADTEVVRVPAGDAAAAVRRLSADPRVEYAEPDARIHALATSDPLAQWNLTTVHAAGAWELSSGDGVTVGVVDSGVVADHEDLAGQVAVGGWDWVDGDKTPDDLNGHGTHVSGTIAAVRGNRVGVAGLAPDAQVMPLRVLDAAGSGADSDAASAFDYAGDHGIRVVNASFGTPTASPTMQTAIHNHPGTLFVVAAGNEHTDVDVTPTYPCAIPEPNVLCVGATDQDDARASFSNFGASSVDVFAPGVDIVSTARPTRSCPELYCAESGTSMATPQVAAVAALIAAAMPDATAAGIKRSILDGGDTVEALGGKRLNALGALRAAGAEPPPAPAPAPPPAPATAPAETPAPTPAVAPVATQVAPTPTSEPTPPVTAPAPTATAAKRLAPRRLRISRRAVERGIVAVTFTLRARATVRITLTPASCCRRTRTVRARAGRTTIRLRAPRRGRYTVSAVALP